MDAQLQAQIQQRQALLDAVRKMMVKQLNLRRAPDELDPDTPVFGSGLGLDSVDAVELIISLEVEFKIRLPDDAATLPALRTVNSIVDTVLARQEGARAG